MQDKLRAEISSYLARHHSCTIASSTGPDPHLVPAHYSSQGLELVCWLPRWVDLVYLLEISPKVELIITEENSQETCWLEYRGNATVLSQLESPWQTSWSLTPPTPYQQQYLLVRVNPVRIDLIDQAHGWGARETLEFDYNEENL